MTLLAIAGMVGASANAQQPPAPGTSPRVDAIRKSGTLRVGVLQNLPWLVENTSGSGEPWSGPAWTLAKEYARQLNVKLAPVRVSNETKIIALGSNQIDISVTSLAVSPEREKVADFVVYSQTAVCFVGKESNAVFAAARSIDDLNKPAVKIGYTLGSPDQLWLVQRIPKATMFSVTASAGEGSLQAVIAGRADATMINKALWPAIKRKVKGMAVLPRDCASSAEKAVSIGMAVAKKQPEFHGWLQAVAKTMQPALEKEEKAVSDAM